MSTEPAGAGGRVIVFPARGFTFGLPPLANERINVMNEKTIDQFEEVLSQDVSDEALEAAGTRTEIAGAWTIVCTGIQCPG